MADPTLDIEFRAITDAPESDRLPAIFAEYWPAYRSWLERAPKLEPFHCRGMLAQHMPELQETYDNLLDRLGGDKDVARFLTMFQPPPLVRACTQLVRDDATGPILLRTYDHHPDLFDGLILRSRWGRVATLAMTDCIWGALDGVNDHGLAIALAFGGRHAIGEGFAAPLVCRYVLQTCTTVAEARAALSRVPVYMAYTFVVVDAAGDHLTAYCGPDRPTAFVANRASTNHQGSVEWEPYARFTQSEARLAVAESLTAAPASSELARRAFLEPPIWRTEYRKGSGTLYAAEYAVHSRALTLHWPARSERFGIDVAEDRAFSVVLPDAPVTKGARSPSMRASEQ